MSSRRTIALCGLFLLGLFCAPRPALAEEAQVAVKRGAFREDAGRITLTLGFRELFTPAMQKQLQSGFATRVVLRVYVFDGESSRQVAFSARTVRAVYDLWEERYLMQFEDEGRVFRRRLARRADVVDRLTSLWRFPIATVEQMAPGKRYFVAVIAEVNPIGEELLAEVRSWLRNPRRSRQVGGGDSLFGSFVSIFVNNKIRRAERTLRIRTQPVLRER